MPVTLSPRATSYHWPRSITTQRRQHFIYLINKYTYWIFLDMLQSSYSFLHTMPCISYCDLFLVHKIFTFYIKSVLKFKCPAPLPKSYGAKEIAQGWIVPHVTKFHNSIQCAACCRTNLELTTAEGFILCKYTAKETQIQFQIRTLMTNYYMNATLTRNLQSWLV